MIVDFQNSRVYGHGGLDAIERLAERYKKVDKTLKLIHLSRDCRQLLDKAGDLISVDFSEDPHYRMALDELS